MNGAPPLGACKTSPGVKNVNKVLLIMAGLLIGSATLNFSLIERLASTARADAGLPRTVSELKPAQAKLLCKHYRALGEPWRCKDI